MYSDYRIYKHITVNMKRFFLTTIATAMLTACGTGSKITSSNSITGEWDIVKIDGKALNGNSENTPFLGFDTKENRIYGNAGCNLITGSLTTDAKAGTIDLSKTGMTRMMCPDMDTESRVTEAMGRISKYSFGKDGALMLNSADGKTVMELKARASKTQK